MVAQLGVALFPATFALLAQSCGEVYVWFCFLCTGNSMWSALEILRAF